MASACCGPDEGLARDGQQTWAYDAVLSVSFLWGRCHGTWSCGDSVGPRLRWKPWPWSDTGQAPTTGWVIFRNHTHRDADTAGPPTSVLGAAFTTLSSRMPVLFLGRSTVSLPNLPSRIAWIWERLSQTDQPFPRRRRPRGCLSPGWLPGSSDGSPRGPGPPSSARSAGPRGPSGPSAPHRLNRTIAANLPRPLYLTSHRTFVPERLVGYGLRQQPVARDIVLAIERSGRWRRR